MYYIPRMTRFESYPRTPQQPQGPARKELLVWSTSEVAVDAAGADIAVRCRRGLLQGSLRYKPF